MYFASGTSIRSFPEDGRVLTRVLRDQGQEVLRGNSADGQIEVNLLSSGKNDFYTGGLVIRLHVLV